MTKCIGFVVPMKVSINKQFANLNLVNSLLRQGFEILWAAKQFRAKTEIFPSGYTYSAGDFIIPLIQTMSPDPKIPETFVFTFVEELSRDLSAYIHRICEVIEIEAYKLSLAPGIGIYSGPGTYDCYLWFQQCLEKMGFMADCLSVSDIERGKLKDYDILVQPGGDETRQSEALWPEGRRKIRTFLRKGGKYIGSCGGFDIAGYADGTPYGSPHTGKIKHLNLIKYDPTRNISRDKFPHDEWARLHYLHIDFNEYSQLIPVKWGTRIPLRIKQPNSPIVFGYHDIIFPGPYYAAGPLPKNLGVNVTSVAEFAPDLLPLDTSWTLPPDFAINLLDGATAIATATFGAGKLVLFSPHPEAPYCEECFKLVANAIFFLMGKGPFKVEITKRKSNSSKLIYGKTTSFIWRKYALEELDGSLFAISQIKLEFDEFKKIWAEMSSKFAEWTYDFVPEYILKLPGYSQVLMPELEIKVLEKKLLELENMICELKFNYDELREIEQKLKNAQVDNKESAKKLLSKSVRGINKILKSMAVINSLKDLVVEANQYLKNLRPKLDMIIQTRFEIDKLKQPPGIENKLIELWRKLDSLQYDFDLEIWAKILLRIDGKAEVPIFSDWKNGILEKHSKGMIPELIKCANNIKRTLEDFKYTAVALTHLIKSPNREC